MFYLHYNCRKDGTPFNTSIITPPPPAVVPPPPTTPHRSPPPVTHIPPGSSVPPAPFAPFVPLQPQPPPPSPPLVWSPPSDNGGGGDPWNSVSGQPTLQISPPSGSGSGKFWSTQRIILVISSVAVIVLVSGLCVTLWRCYRNKKYNRYIPEARKDYQRPYFNKPPSQPTTPFMAKGTLILFLPRRKNKTWVLAHWLSFVLQFLGSLWLSHTMDMEPETDCTATLRHQGLKRAGERCLLLHITMLMSHKNRCNNHRGVSSLMMLLLPRELLIFLLAWILHLPLRFSLFPHFSNTQTASQKIISSVKGRLVMYTKPCFLMERCDNVPSYCALLLKSFYVLKNLCVICSFLRWGSWAIQSTERRATVTSSILSQTFWNWNEGTYLSFLVIVMSMVKGCLCMSTVLMVRFKTHCIWTANWTRSSLGMCVWISP